MFLVTLERRMTQTSFTLWCTVNSWGLVMFGKEYEILGGMTEGCSLQGTKAQRIQDFDHQSERKNLRVHARQNTVQRPCRLRHEECLEIWRKRLGFCETISRGVVHVSGPSWHFRITGKPTSDVPKKPPASTNVAVNGTVTMHTSGAPEGWEFGKNSLSVAVTSWSQSNASAPTMVSVSTTELSIVFPVFVMVTWNVAESPSSL